MEDNHDRLAQAERDAERALGMMQHGHGFDSYTWPMLVLCVGEADSIVRDARRRNPTLQIPAVEQAIAELYEITSGFTDPSFLRYTRAARRRYRVLFSTP